MKIKFAVVYVDDQDKALDFYTNKLGFTVKQDQSYGPNARWLSVASEDNSEVELLLEKVSSETGTKEFQKKMFEAGKPANSFYVKDIEKIYKELLDEDVEFTMKPSKQPYGGIDAVLKDDCGNLINLHQE